MSAKAAAHDNSIPSPGNLGTKLGETTKFKHNGLLAKGTAQNQFLQSIWKIDSLDRGTETAIQNQSQQIEGKAAW